MKDKYPRLLTIPTPKTAHDIFWDIGFIQGNKKIPGNTRFVEINTISSEEIASKNLLTLQRLLFFLKNTETSDLEILGLVIYCFFYFFGGLREQGLTKERPLTMTQWWTLTFV
jgi:hypothetical protein